METNFDYDKIAGLPKAIGGRIDLLEKMLGVNEREDLKPSGSSKMNFDYDNVNALSNALGERIQLLEELIESNGLSQDQVDVIADSDFRKDFIPVYGFHIDSEESDPSEAVTYLADAVGMKPAFMDYSKGEFNYGSWEDAFFMPRPCMLKYDGTVDYYLDPNDYSKKEDGTDSDVADFEYGGNAMMEWGRNGHQIWYKIVPDEDDNTSASIYFCEYKLDESYHAWSFINNQGNLVDHFYTPIYNGTIDGDGKLRSISGKDYTALCQSKTVQQEINAAELNNPAEDKLWYTEVFADITLINLLLVLIGKCLNTQMVFGNGVCDSVNFTAADMVGTGTMDDKGLFFGSNDAVTGVKVFGMENYWANQCRRIAGLMSVGRTIKYKMTYGMDDGSEASAYNTTGADYLDGPSFDANHSGYFTKCMFEEDGSILFNSFNGSKDMYYTDYGNIYSSTVYACRGGFCFLDTWCGAFTVDLGNSPSLSIWYCGASPSCKPLVQSN